MRRRLPVFAWIPLVAWSLAACGDQGGRAPFAESRTPPSLNVRFQPPAGWAWGYVRVGDDLVQRYGVSAPHGAPRGQVLILPGYGHATSFAPDVTATQAMVKAVIRPKGQDPFVILGAGDGGVVALRALEEGLQADSLVLSSPNFDVADLPRPKGELIRIARWARTLKLGFLRYPGQAGWKREGPDGFAARLTHDRQRGAVQQAWRLANPDLRMGAPSLAWYAAFYDAVDATGRDLERVRIPVVMLDAGQDVKALPQPQSAVCAALPRCVETRYPTARHALHLETAPVRVPWLRAIETALQAPSPIP